MTWLVQWNGVCVSDPQDAVHLALSKTGSVHAPPLELQALIQRGVEVLMQRGVAAPMQPVVQTPNPCHDYGTDFP
jgi:hypothetical protein